MGSDALSMAECQNEMQKLFKEYGVTPFTPLKGIFIQGPIFVSFFLAISTMVEKMESFKFVGAYWFTDLSTPDSLYIFPVMTVLTFLLTVEIVSESQKRLPTEDKSGAGIRIHDNNGGEESAAVRFEGEVSLGDLIWLKLLGKTWWPAVVVDERSVSKSSKPGKKSKGEVLVRLYGSHEYSYADPMKYRSEFKTILEQNNGSYYDILEKGLEQFRSRLKSSKPKGQGSKATANTRAEEKETTKKKNPQQKGSNVEEKASKKLKRKSPSTDKQGKKKADEQEGPLKKQKKNNQTVEPNSRSAKAKPKSSTSKEQKKSKASKQGKEQKKPKRNKPNSIDTKSRTSKEKKLLEETDDQSSEGSSPGESPKSGARRTRVMQGLGLIAPPGSPFHKNGLI